MGGGWSAPRPGTHCTGGWVGPRAGLDGCGKISPPTGIRSPDRPARNESLYRLRYPGLYIPLPYLYSDMRQGGAGGLISEDNLVLVLMEC
jgi:hypothetical protein